MTKQSNLLTTTEAAEMLNLHVNTVRRWANEGILKAYRIGVRSDRRFVREDLETFLRSKDNIPPTTY